MHFIPLPTSFSTARLIGSGSLSPSAGRFSELTDSSRAVPAGLLGSAHSTRSWPQTGGPSVTGMSRPRRPRCRAGPPAPLGMPPVRRLPSSHQSSAQLS